MAYAKALSEKRFSDIHRELSLRAHAVAQSAYRSKLAKAKTPRQREACCGSYTSAWSHLLDLWCRDKVPNIQVYECLKLDSIYVVEHLVAPLVDGGVTSFTPIKKTGLVKGVRKLAA